MVVLRHLYIFIFTIKRGEVVSVRKKDVWYVIKTRAIGKNRDLDFLRDGKKTNVGRGGTKTLHCFFVANSCVLPKWTCCSLSSGL
jgi:hypothetical protein